MGPETCERVLLMIVVVCLCIGWVRRICVCGCVRGGEGGNRRDVFCCDINVICIMDFLFYFIFLSSMSVYYCKYFDIALMFFLHV